MFRRAEAFLPGLPVLTALFGLALCSCETAEDFRIVELRVEGVEGGQEYSTFSLFPYIFVPTEKGGAARMPIGGEPDLWVELAGQEVFVPLLSSDTDTLVLSSDDILVRLGGGGVATTDYEVFAAVRHALGLPPAEPQYAPRRPGEVDPTY